MTGSVVIDALPEQAVRYRDSHAVIAVDAFRATTSILTALAAGRQVYPVTSLEEATRVARSLPFPLLAGEVAGGRPMGFELNNSPDRLAASRDQRPLVLLSSAGTQLLAYAHGGLATYVACFRNFSATANYVGRRHRRVALIGAGTRGEPRLEDQMLCAWIAARLTKMGFHPEDAQTRLAIHRFVDADIALIRHSPSADYLRSSGQEADIDFVISHIDDLDLVVAFDGTQAGLVGSGSTALGEASR